MTERNLDLTEKEKNKITILAKRGEWFMVNSTFGFAVTEINAGHWDKPVISFICDQRIGIARTGTTAKHDTRQKTAKISRITFTVKTLQPVSIETASKESITAIGRIPQEQQLRVEITSDNPIILQQGLDDMEIFEVLEQELAKEIGKDNTYLPDRFTSR